jgi:hypothetical protein
MFDKLLFQ